MADGFTQKRLEAVVRRIAPEASFEAREMEGGASTRRFFRVRMGDNQSAIAMYVPDTSKPDEIAKTAEGDRRWPFLEVRDLLAAHGVRVPRIVAEACDDNLILVEDLGDNTLARYLEQHPERREQVYQAAIRDLARAQSALSDLPSESIVRQRSFDRDLLGWEVDHFLEWGLEARDVRLSDDDLEVFTAARDYLAETIAGWPRHFVHRDYQSRNLMVQESDGQPELTWIDFQDALLGPRVYDLVALLNDSYQTFTPEFVEARLDEYSRHLGHDDSQRRQVGREFRIVTVQRKLKDAGRFVFIDRQKNNSSFLKFVEPTIEKAKLALAELDDEPRLAALLQLLNRVL